MANVLYDPARQKFLEGDIHWLTDNIKIMLVDAAAYTFSAAHDYLDHVITGGSPSPRVGTDQMLTGKTSTNGVADANDPTFTAVVGPSVEAAIIYKDSGASPQDPATCPVIGYMDSAIGLPFTPDGGNRTIVFDNGVNKIFKL